MLEINYTQIIKHKLQDLIELKNLNLDVNYSGLESIFNGAIGLVSNKNDGKFDKKEFILYSSYKDINRINRD